MNEGIIDQLRERLERVESQRIRPRVILTAVELRALMDQLDVLEDEIDALVRARNEAQAET